MSKKIENGQKRKTEVEQKSPNSISVNSSGCLGAVGQESSKHGTEQIRFSGDDCSIREPLGTRLERRIQGKIIRQLKLLKQRQLDYVDAHTERLRLRLAEDEEHRKLLLHDVEQLEEELKELIESELTEEEE